MQNISLTGGAAAPQDPVPSTPLSTTAGAANASPGELMADAPIVLNAIDGPPIDAKLTVEQAAVLRAVMSGKTISAAAQAGGVSRSTVYRWQSESAAYIAAVNAWQRQTHDSARNRMLAMADKAIVAVHSALLSCDARTAMSLLKGLGILQPIAPGSTQPENVTQQIELDRRAEKLHLLVTERQQDRDKPIGRTL